jgi:hypothetical protein
VKLSSVPRELRASVKEALGRGWSLQVAGRRNHNCLFKQGAGHIWLPKTPSDVHGWKNCRSEMRKKGACS